ncbi:MAG TPA: glycosyltransferase family 4 protein [Ignavibacteria bacterium]|nr:glycosyltransferase family 4 protein [Ignavibacteria bacterium]
MKLAILTQYFYPETGAPQNRLLELARLFKKDGWDVSVITAMPNYPKGKIFKEYEGKFMIKEELDGLQILRYWLYASNKPKSIPRIISMLTISFTTLFGRSYLKKFKPDYILAESPPLILGVTAVILSRLCGAKLIMNVSDIWPLTAKELGSIGDGKLYNTLEKLERYIYKNSFICSGQSEEITDHIKKSGGKKTYLFRNGVDIKRFESVNKKKNDGSGNLKIIYAGLIGLAQGVPDIAMNIDFAGVGAELHIYGEGGEKKMLEDYLKKNPDKNVFLHNSVNRDEIPGLLMQHDCALIPLIKNIYGAVPSKIYEAMAAGLPVLFSGTGEGAKIISENNVGLVSKPKDFTALRENIIRLKGSKDLRDKMSANGMRTAAEKFDRNKIIKNFSETLKNYSN